MKIPVFVSCPTKLNSNQESSRAIILQELSRCGVEPRAIGRSDYPTDLPLREVFVLARHCAGGVILGFEQFRSERGVWKPGSAEERLVDGPQPFPSSWNHLEAGIIFALGLPTLVFRENGIAGGVFDPGVSDVFVHPMPLAPISRTDSQGLRAVFMKWQAKVREVYYR